MQLTTLLVASAACTASAFVAPSAFNGVTVKAPMTQQTTTVSMSYLDGIVGVGPESGNKPWDPLGLSVMYEQGLGNTLPIACHPKWLREAELKHCRMAMLAFVGVMVNKAGIIFPGLDYSITDWNSAISEFTTKNPLGLAQVFAFIALMEGVFYPGDMWTGGGDREAGDYGLDISGAKRKGDQAAIDKARLSELKNGRLAMWACAAFAAEHFIPGSVPLLAGF